MTHAQVQVKAPRQTNSLLVHAEEPGECPLCGKAIHAEVLAGYCKWKPPHDWDTSATWVLYRCPRAECQEVFLACYTNGPPNLLRLVRCFPATAKGPQVSLEVAQVSPAFVRIQAQALTADAYGLDEIAGIGLRKALEFLIKDFLQSRTTDADRKAAIQKTLLGPCIKDFVDDPNLKKCAERATWLGNDETHYVRKWTGKDIGDLKTLIHLTVNWIDTLLVTERYEREMPAKQ